MALWIGLPVISCGLLAWAPFLYFAVTARERRWFIATAVYLLALALSAGARAAGLGRVGGVLWLGMMLAGSIHLLLVRSDMLNVLAIKDDPDVRAAKQAALRRREAHRLVAREPDRARVLGVGRPDLPRSFDGGVVDVNHVPAYELARLPGLDEDGELRARVARAVAELGPFSSLEDLDLAVDLPRRVVADLRERAVFLPD